MNACRFRNIASALALFSAAVIAGCQTAVPVVPNTGGSNTSGGTTGGTSSSSGGGISGGSNITPSVSASLLAQLSLERINRARLKPAQEAAMNGIAVDEGIPGQLNATPKQPLALNAALNTAARVHAQDMLNRNFFDHVTPEGVSPFDRMRNAGYIFLTAGENLAWRGTTGTIDEVSATENQHVDLFVDTDIPDRGHRKTMLNNNFREIGLAVLRGNFTREGTTFDSMMQAQEFGARTGDSVFVLGVVYSDLNNNNRYDFGEGTANSTVTLNGVAKATNAAGGYAFEVLQGGSFTLRFASGQTTNFNIQLGDPNIKVDLVDRVTVVTNLGLGLLP